MSSEETSPGLQLKTSITDASRKIESIIDDAERAATEIRADAKANAEREAKRALNESSAELAAVVNPLIERVENLRVEAAALMHEIETATAKLSELARVTGVATPAAPPVPEEAMRPAASPPVDRAEPVAATSSPGPVPVAYPGRGREEASAAVPEEAVLRATQMAVAGSSRAEIETTLSDEFGLEDPTPVVNDILGEG